MDLRNVKNLQRKMHMCGTIYTIGLVCSLLSLFAGWIVYELSPGWGIFLCCLAVFLALITGTAQVMESYLCAEDMYRITGRRPRKKKKKPGKERSEE